jgi:hypothetical protein
VLIILIAIYGFALRRGQGEAEARALAFTTLIIVLVLAPLIFAFGALLIETQALLVEVAAAAQHEGLINRLFESVMALFGISVLVCLVCVAKQIDVKSAIPEQVR